MQIKHQGMVYRIRHNIYPMMKKVQHAGWPARTRKSHASPPPESPVTTCAGIGNLPLRSAAPQGDTASIAGHSSHPGNVRTQARANGQSSHADYRVFGQTGRSQRRTHEADNGLPPMRRIRA